MVHLDTDGELSGYWPSPWPAESGGPRRQKVAALPGLNLAQGESLGSTIRETGGWAVMTVQRNPEELYLLCGGGLLPGEFPPYFRESSSHGWVERIDPISLNTLNRSKDLPSGGWLWCGAIVAHKNGDLYAVNGRYIFRFDAECNVIAERELPFDGPFNGLVIMSDGNLVTRNLGFREDDSACFLIIDPEDLNILCDPVLLDARCMGRFSSDKSETGEFIYTTTEKEIIRLNYVNSNLVVDSWKRSYEIIGEAQSDAWDTTIGDNRIWLMDMGRPPGWMRPGTAEQRAFGFSLTDETEKLVFANHASPFAWNPGPPLFDPKRKILVHYDSLNGGVVGHYCPGGSEIEQIWRIEAHNYLQMMVFKDTGELIIEDAELPPNFGGERIKAEAVVVNIETGEEISRVASGAPSLGMFSSPGFSRDFYVASLLGTLARVYVQG